MQVFGKSRQLEEAMQATSATCLVSKNIRINERRTSVRLEPEMWDALIEIAHTENCSIHDLCTMIADTKSDGSSFTASLRVFLMAYYRATIGAS